MNINSRIKKLDKIFKDIEDLKPINRNLIKSELSVIREENLDIYERYMIKYIAVLEKVIVSNKTDVINIILDKISKSGYDSLTKYEKNKLKFYEQI